MTRAIALVAALLAGCGDNLEPTIHVDHDVDAGPDAAPDAPPDACTAPAPGPDDCCRFAPDGPAVLACSPTPAPGTCAEYICRLPTCELFTVGVCTPLGTS